MTYAEIKNQFTTVEAVDNRIKRLNDLESEYSQDAEKMRAEMSDKMEEWFKSILPNASLVTFDTSYIELECSDRYHRLEMRYGYEVDYKSNDWKFRFDFNIASCGNFNPTDDEDPVTIYYKSWNKLIDNASELKSILLAFSEEVKVMKEKFRSLHSEMMQLEILKKNLSKENEMNEYVKLAMEEENKEMFVIIRKKAIEEKDATAFHRNDPCIIISAPSSEDNYEGLKRTCNTLWKQSNKVGHFIPVKIKTLKFNNK